MLSDLKIFLLFLHRKVLLRHLYHLMLMLYANYLTELKNIYS